MPEVAVAVVYARPDGPARHLRYRIVGGCPCSFAYVFCHRPRLCCQRRQPTNTVTSTMIAMIASDHRRRRRFIAHPWSWSEPMHPDIPGVVPQHPLLLLGRQTPVELSPRVLLGSLDERLTKAPVQPGAALLIGSGNVPLWITHDEEGSANPRGLLRHRGSGQAPRPGVRSTSRESDPHRERTRVSAR